MGLCQLDGAGRGFIVDADCHQTLDAGLVRPLDNLIKILDIRSVIEVTMTVEQFHFFPCSMLDVQGSTLISFILIKPVDFPGRVKFFRTAVGLNPLE
jgi:hypothetical protein